jgi:ribosomal protein L7Ae-like RNA K-turn-binding protein
LINNKILGLIGFAARARKICFGADSVEEQIKKKKVNIVIVAEDASERTKTKFKNLGEEYKISVFIIGKIDEISKSIGKSNKAIIGIQDINLSNEIKRIINGGDVIGKNQNT